MWFEGIVIVWVGNSRGCDPLAGVSGYCQGLMSVWMLLYVGCTDRWLCYLLMSGGMMPVFWGLVIWAAIEVWGLIAGLSGSFNYYTIIR